jgi:hypothetical protein
MSGLLSISALYILLYKRRSSVFCKAMEIGLGEYGLITANIIKCHPKVLEPLFHEFKATVEVHHPIMVLMILRGLFTIQIRSK